jgi:hypothetical protein
MDIRTKIMTIHFHFPHDRFHRPLMLMTDSPTKKFVNSDTISKKCTRKHVFKQNESSYFTILIIEFLKLHEK